MAASSNPLQRGSQACSMFVHQNHAAGGGNSSIMVGMFVCLYLASQKPSEREFFIPTRMDLVVKLLTGIPPLGFGQEQKTPALNDSYSTNSTENTVTLTQHPPQTSLPWWCRLPLLQPGICGSARSDTGNLF
jgi:hypothetical protein